MKWTILRLAVLGAMVSALPWALGAEAPTGGPNQRHSPEKIHRELGSTNALATRSRVNAGKLATNPSSSATGFELQKLVRYFQKPNSVPGKVNGSVSFRPPVSEAELSKLLTPPSGAKK